MASIHGKNLDHTVNTKSLESQVKSVELAVDVDTAEDTAAGDSAKTHVEGMYGWGMDAEMNWDPAANQNDVTLFALLGQGAKTIDLTPGGGTESSTNPKYTGSAIMTSFRLSVPHDGLCSLKASYKGTGALARDVTP